MAESVSVAQVITGHDWFARHRARLGEEPTEGICRLCGLDVEEAAHLFWDCPALGEERATFLDVSKENMTKHLSLLNAENHKICLTFQRVLPCVARFLTWCCHSLFCYIDLSFGIFFYRRCMGET